MSLLPGLNLTPAAAAVLLVAPAFAQSASVALKPEVSGAIHVLDSWLQAAVASHEEPGLSIGIVCDQELVWKKGYGFADAAKKIPAVPSTLYRIGSVSKLFTATAIMQLRDQGRLRLDDPVSSYLPWFRIKPSHPDDVAITIRHLLTHTSGMPRELPLSYWNDLKFPSREEMMRLIPSQSAIFPPETEFKYSNLALAIAGEVVAAVSGEPYPRYIQEHVLNPLGMTATRIVPEQASPGLAIGYRKRVPGQPREVEDFLDSRALTPAANLASNVDDLAKLVALQFRDGPASGPQVLKGSTLREMHRIQWLQPDWLSGQGLGFWIHRSGPQVRVGHDGAVPGFKSQIDFSVPDKLGVIVLINGYDADPMFYVNEAFSIVGRAVAAVTTQPKPTLATYPVWQQYVGTYTWKHVDVQILIIGGELTMIVPDASNPWDSRVRLKPVGPHTFKMAGGSMDGELLKFEVDSSGKVTKLTAGSYYRIRVQ
jgi:CubicO group peptidase (beta-lactamase class C family)